MSEHSCRRGLILVWRFVLSAFVSFGFLSGAMAQTVWINWSDLYIGSTTARHFGSNDEQCGNFTAGALDTNYATSIATVGIKFIRIHTGGMISAWTTNNAWDVTKITTYYNAAYIQAAGGDNLMQNIPTIPSWCLNADGTVNSASYASFCAELVRIVNITLGKRVKYWEPLNEFESNFFSGNETGLFSLYNQCAKAMKAVDPTIKVGGPAACWANHGFIDRFLTSCWSNIDFISWHRYMVGYSGSDIYGAVMSQVGALKTEVDNIRTSIDYHRAHGYTDGRTIELALDEINIPCSYVYTGWGQQGYIGATFFAAALKVLVEDQVNIITSWSTKGGIYGMIDMNDALRPPASFYQWANASLIGQIARSGTDQPDCVVLPILRAATLNGNKHSMLLINKSASACTIRVQHNLSLNQWATVSSIDSTGVSTLSPVWIDSALPVFALPAFSCLLVTMP